MRDEMSVDFGRGWHGSYATIVGLCAVRCCPMRGSAPVALSGLGDGRMVLDDKLQLARQRVTQIFRYLKALNEHRNPAVRQVREQLWHLWFRDLPRHPAVSVPAADAFEAIADDEDDVGGAGGIESGDRFILRVRRPQLTSPPAPPDEIAEWLHETWSDPHADLRVLQSPAHEAEGSPEVVERFEDDPHRQQLFEQWMPRREDWAQGERPCRDAMRVFERLYEIHSWVQREAEQVELVLGDGILSWRRQEGGIYHPVLLQRVQLEFDPNVPQFTVEETDDQVDLYSGLFNAISDVNGRDIAKCRDDLDESPCHPLGGDITTTFLRKMAARLSSRGEFVEDGPPRAETEHPSIGRSPVLFLRRRTLGFATALEAVLDDIATREDLPGSLTRVVGLATPTDESTEDVSPVSPWIGPEGILFTKPANAEQAEIARRLSRHPGVLVQGPPGTGKTHTIANLLGHLLAQGQSVLVTAQTTKALRVVRDQVVEPLRPLCVSVLERDIDSRGQLKVSVEQIVERLSQSDAGRLERQADEKQAQRAQLRSELARKVDMLRNARADEYRVIVVAGQEYRPVDGARLVAAGQGRDDWIPSPVALGEPLPLSNDELAMLYRSNETITPSDEHELSCSLPELSELPSPDEFERLVGSAQALSSEGANNDAYWSHADTDNEDPEYLEQLAVRLIDAATSLDTSEKWRLAAADAGRLGGASRQPWDNLASNIDDACEEAAQARELLYAHAPALPEGISLEEQIATLGEVLTHLREGGRIGRLAMLLRPHWRRTLSRARTNGRRPSSRDDIAALHALAALMHTREMLRSRWDRQMAWLGAPFSSDLGEEPERTCSQFVPHLRACMDWYSAVWLPMADELLAHGFCWDAYLDAQPPDLSDHGHLLRLRSAMTYGIPALLRARADAIRCIRARETLTAVGRALAGVGRDFRSEGIVTSALRRAVADRDAAAYLTAFVRLVALNAIRTDLQGRNALLARLRAVAPTWASSIGERSTPHDQRAVPGDASAAWTWRQLHDELTNRGMVSLDDLQADIEQLSDELRRVTADLVERRAWAAQLRRTTLEQQQALMGWLNTVRTRGFATGRRASRLRAEAAKRMSESRTAVPVWIMPLSRVAENFDPRTTRFDVAIIDEASQSDVMALLVFYLARKVVVVGDREQVSPAAVAQRLDVVQHLIDEHLQGIPNAVLYTGQRSVYDVASESFPGLICLLEHFRCVPQIIQFSNHLSYNGRIRPLRDPSRVQLRPHVVPYRVNAASREGKVNSEEAIVVASLLAAALEQPEYEGKEFGIISMVGEEQAEATQQLLLAHVGAVALDRHRIVCGNPAHFQGDERDVMFLSLVDSPGEKRLDMRQEERFKERFNVAASRAKDQMWIVYSLDPGKDLQPLDLRRRLIEHALDPDALLRQMNVIDSAVESELERQVAHRLVAAGYEVRTQVQVGNRRIDLVVEGSSARLAVECDGDRYHTLDRLEEDMARQALLERCDWTFARIRGTAFFRDPDAAMRPIFERLASMGILPKGAAEEAARETDALDDLKERVVRRAAELRKEWSREAARGVGDGETTDRTRSHAEEVAPPPIATRSARPELRNAVAQTVLPGVGVSAEERARKIDEVPQAEVRLALSECVPETGEVEREDLLHAVAARLGFSKLGKNIRKRVNRAIAAEVRAGRLESDSITVSRRAE